MTEIELTISSRLKQLLPVLSKEENEQLEQNIVSDGVVLDPILFWHDGKKNLVVDGMHRYAIASKKNIPFKTKEMKFADIEAVEVWLLDHALGRRHLLKPAEIRKVRGELYNRLKGERGGDHKSEEKSKCQIDTLKTDSAQKVAEKAGVSPATVKRDGKYVESLEKLNPAVKKAVEEKRLPVTDDQLHALAKLDATEQQAVARDVRTGTKVEAALVKAGATVKEKKPKAPKCEHSWVNDGNGERYCEHCKEDHPENAKPKKPGKEKVSAAKLVDELTRKHIGYLVRGIDSVAQANGGKGPVHKEADAAMNTLIGCLKKMRAGEK